MGETVRRFKLTTFIISFRNVQQPQSSFKSELHARVRLTVVGGRSQTRDRRLPVHRHRARRLVAGQGRGVHGGGRLAGSLVAGRQQVGREGIHSLQLRQRKRCARSAKF